MATRCTAEQLAEVVTLWSIDINPIPIMCTTKEKVDSLKQFDLILSAISIFIDAFEKEFKTAFDNHKQKFELLNQNIELMKRNFIDYLKPRCLLLSQENSCFDLMMTCAFVSDALHAISYENNCLHLSGVTCNLQKNILEDKFGEKFGTDSGWEKLVCYCKKIHDKVLSTKEILSADFPEANDDSSNKVKEVDSEAHESNEELTKGFVVVHKKNGFSDDDFTEQTVSNKMETGTSTNGDSTNKDKVDCEASESKEGLSESYCIVEKKTGSSGEDFTEQTVSNKMEVETSAYSSVLHKSPETESPDEANENNSNVQDIIRKIICDDEEHLAHISDIIKDFKNKMEYDSQLILITKKDVDFEYKGAIIINTDESEAKILANAAKNAIRREKNEELCYLSQNGIFSEDITDEEQLGLTEAIVVLSDEQPCEQCLGNKRAYKTKWLKNFREKYPNCDLLSDYLKTSII